MRYDVPILNQSVSPICYVVCAAMIQKYWQGTYDTTYLTGGADPSNSCIPGASTNDAASNGLRDAGFVLLPSPSYTMTAAHVSTLLANNGPLILIHLCANFNYGPGRGGKRPANAIGVHAVVITGIEGNAAYFNNPWGDKDVMIPVSDLMASIAQAYAAGYDAIGYANASAMSQNIIY